MWVYRPYVEPKRFQKMKIRKFEIAVAGYDYRFKTYARDGVEGLGQNQMLPSQAQCRMHDSYPCVERVPAGKRNPAAGRYPCDDTVD